MKLIFFSFYSCSFLWKCKPANTVHVQADYHDNCTKAEFAKKRKKSKNQARVGKLERHAQKLQEKITPILFGRQSIWRILYCSKVSKMLANLHHHSATLKGHTTKLHTFNIQNSTPNIGKLMSCSRWGQGKAEKKISLSLCNLSAQWLKT